MPFQEEHHPQTIHPGFRLADVLDRDDEYFQLHVRALARAWNSEFFSPLPGLLFFLHCFSPALRS